jgi:hypothetical protein
MAAYSVVPADAGIQCLCALKKTLDGSLLLQTALRAIRFGILPSQSGSAEGRSTLSLSKGRNDEKGGVYSAARNRAMAAPKRGMSTRNAS